MSTEFKEEWYVFDMSPEHIDPRFVYWLGNNGVVLRVNETGRSPGVIANTVEKMHPNFVPQDLSASLEPLMITVGETETIGGSDRLRALLDEYDVIRGKPQRVARNPLDENYGRSPDKKKVAKCLSEWMDEVKQLLIKVKECDFNATDGKYQEKLGLMLSEVEWISAGFDRVLND